MTKYRIVQKGKFFYPQYYNNCFFKFLSGWRLFYWGENLDIIQKFKTQKHAEEFIESKRPKKEDVEIVVYEVEF